jgi:hypothetical protein
MIPDQGPAPVGHAFDQELAQQAIEAEARRLREKVVAPDVVEHVLSSCCALGGASVESEILTPTIRQAGGALGSRGLQVVDLLFTIQAILTGSLGGASVPQLYLCF